MLWLLRIQYMGWALALELIDIWQPGVVPPTRKRRICTSQEILFNLGLELVQ